MQTTIFNRWVWLVLAVLEARLLDAAIVNNEWREFGLSSLVLVVTAAAVIKFCEPDTLRR